MLFSNALRSGGGGGMTSSAGRCGRQVRTLCVLALLVPLWFVVTAVPADASCAPPPPASSAQRFTGVVVSVSDQGRTATVRTDDGRTVTVTGRGDPSGAITSVDRTYTAGARYEFHPLNDASPYRDNACTATRELSSTGGAAAGPVDGNSRGSGPVVWGAAALIVVLLVLGALGVRRRATRAHPAAAPRS